MISSPMLQRHVYGTDDYGEVLRRSNNRASHISSLILFGQGYTLIRILELNLLQASLVVMFTRTEQAYQGLVENLQQN